MFTIMPLLLAVTNGSRVLPDGSGIGFEGNRTGQQGVAKTNRKQSNAKPISSHPLFPAVVALWFGALLGLGSLAIRPTLLEAVVVKAGVDLIIPAAAPPLGFTARIMIASALAAIGAAVGASLALRVNRANTVAPPRKRNAGKSRSAAKAGSTTWDDPEQPRNTRTRRPISAHEELGEALVSRRRPLTVEHLESTLAPPEFAAEPDAEPVSASFDTDAGLSISDQAPVSPAPEPLNLGEFPAPAEVEPALPEPQFEMPRLQATPPQFAAPVAAAADLPPLRPDLPGAAPDGIIDLATRLRETITRCRATIAAADMPQPPEPAIVQAAAQPAESDFVPPPPLNNLFPLDTIDTVPLAAQAAPLAPMPMPAALRPVNFDLAEDEEPLELATLVPRHLPMPTALTEAAAQDAAGAETGEIAASPASERPRQEFVRIEEPEDPGAAIEPVVIFPGQMAGAPMGANRPFDGPANAPMAVNGASEEQAAMVDPGDAERALRQALVSLQRLSGAA